MVWDQVFVFICLLVGHFLPQTSLAKTWIWQGALMPRSVRFSVKTEDAVEDFRIVAVIEGKSNLSFARLLEKSVLSYDEEDANGLTKHQENGFKKPAARSFQMLIEGLEPNTSYRWSAGEGIDGRFRTPPPLGTPFNFTFAFGSCADNDSDHVLFSLIPENERPLFFIHTGDLHYGNLHRDNFNDYSAMFDRTLTQPNQALLYHNIPTVYMWDDHDFGPNNADKSNPGRRAALQAYRYLVPSYLLATKRDDGAVYHSFVIGRILFVVTDTSSERVHDDMTTLGDEQLEWLKAKIRSVANRPTEYLAMVWVSTMPWVDEHYKWGEFPGERQYIGNYIQELGLSDRIILVSGDAHMVAVDDGSHSVGGIKVFQAAALDAKPTTKGGPYSHGVWPGRNQYGTMEVRDMGDKICFFFQGWRWKRDKVVSRLVQFDTCDPTKNIPFLYTPSPLFVQKTWKRLKKVLEESNIHVLKALVVYIDSTRITMSNLTDPRILLLIGSIPFVVSGVKLVCKWVLK